MRRFNKQQRIALYLASDGRCVLCGTLLEPGWHADHIVPWAAHGETDVVNGQALCPSCNLRKGKKVYIKEQYIQVSPWTLPLRSWQEQCFNTLRNKGIRTGQANFAISVIMGAGKTIFILRWMHFMLQTRSARLGIVVVPSDNLRTQFCQDAKNVHIHAYALRDKQDTKSPPDERISTVSGLDTPLPHDIHILVLTYQQLTNANVSALIKVSQEVKVVWACDEVHHTGGKYQYETDADMLRWASGLSQGAKFSVARLLTTATPNRTDGRPIPYLSYTDDNLPIFDFVYDYEQALRDGIVRPIEFVQMDGEIQWSEMDDMYDVRLSEKISKRQHSRRLNTAVDPRFGWIRETLRRANACLMSIRQDSHPDAGGLVVARGKKEARDIASYLEETFKVKATVVTDDDKDATQKIRRFEKGTDEWIVSVRMVSEGTDIKRLRVLAYCTNVTTELSVLQILGRIIRVLPHITPQLAYAFVPEEERIMAIVETYRKMVVRALKDKQDTSGPGGEISVIDQTPLWAAGNATGLENGRLHDGLFLPPDVIEEARPFADGNHFAESAIAKYIISKRGYATTHTEQIDSQPLSMTTGQSWDTEKHHLYDQFNKAKSRLAHLRLNTGQYTHIGDAKKSVNDDMYDIYGPLNGYRDNVDILRQARDKLFEMITQTGGDVHGIL